MSEICPMQPELASFPPANAGPKTIPSEVGLLEKIKRTAGKVTVAATGILIMHGVIAPDSATGEKPGRSDGITSAKIAQHPEHVGYGMLAECADPAYDDPDYKQVRTALCLMNKVRDEPLKLDKDLSLSAERKLTYIFQCGNIAHDPCGEGMKVALIDFPWERFESMGENIAFGHGLTSGSMQNRFLKLMESPTHRANIQNGNFDSVGIATILLNDGRITVYHFGQSKPEAELTEK